MEDLRNSSLVTKSSKILNIYMMFLTFYSYKKINLIINSLGQTRQIGSILMDNSTLEICKIPNLNQKETYDPSQTKTILKLFKDKGLFTYLYKK